MVADERLAEGEARFLQFQDQIANIIAQGSAGSTVANDIFALLPPVGFLPVALAQDTAEMLARLLWDYFVPSLAGEPGGEAGWGLEVIAAGLEKQLTQPGFVPSTFFSGAARYGQFVNWDAAHFALRQSYLMSPVASASASTAPDDVNQRATWPLSWYYVAENLAALLAWLLGSVPRSQPVHRFRQEPALRSADRASDYDPECPMTVRVGTLTVRTARPGARRDAGFRVRVESALRALDLEPPGVADRAVLVVRRVELTGVNDSAARRARQTLADWRRRATRPAWQPVDPSAGAVLFTDEVELLACLTVDLADGVADQRWYWSKFGASSSGAPSFARAAGPSWRKSWASQATWLPGPWPGSTPVRPERRCPCFPAGKLWRSSPVCSGHSGALVPAPG